MKGLKVRASHQDSLGYELAVFFFFLYYFVCYCYQSAEYRMKLSKDCALCCLHYNTMIALAVAQLW